MSKFADTIKHELAEMVPPTIYFFVILHLVAFIRVPMNKNTGIELTTSTSIAVAALILGKAVLLANALPFINRFPEKPLIWNVCWKTALYFLADTLSGAPLRLLERGSRAGGRQQEVACRDRMAAFFGHTDSPSGVDPDVMHSERVRSRSRRGQIESDVLRPSTCGMSQARCDPAGGSRNIGARL